MANDKKIAVLSNLIRPVLEPYLPDWVEPRWFASTEELMEYVGEAEIGWFDLYDHVPMAEAVKRAVKLKWLNSIYAGLDFLPLDVLADRQVVITNGAGISAITIAEYTVMLMLNFAKGYRDVVRAQDRQEWLTASPGIMELAGSKALLLGYGAIGKLIETRLKAFDVDVAVVRRSGGSEGTLGPNAWRARLGEFDWVVLALPATAETAGIIGQGELKAMKDSAVLVNIARGSVVDQAALVTALQNKSIGGALLDVTTPEPLPAGHELWGLDNAHITMHLSGRAQDQMFARSARRFLENLERYGKGEPLMPIFDPVLGY